MTLSFGDLITLEIAAAFLCHYTERSALLDDQFALACFLPNDKLVRLLISPALPLPGLHWLYAATQPWIK